MEIVPRATESEKLFFVRYSISAIVLENVYASMPYKSRVLEMVEEKSDSVVKLECLCGSDVAGTENATWGGVKSLFR